MDTDIAARKPGSMPAWVITASYLFIAHTAFTRFTTPTAMFATTSSSRVSPPWDVGSPSSTVISMPSSCPFAFRLAMRSCIMK